MRSSTITLSTPVPKSLISEIFIVLSLVFFSLPQTTIGVSNNQIIVNSLMLSIVLLLVFPMIGILLKTVMLDKFLLLFIFYSFITLLWSASPIATSIFLLKFLTATLFGYYLVAKYDSKVFFRYLIVFLTISAVLSLAASVLFPQYFVHRGIAHSGEWKGIFGHKNALGTICVIGISTMQIWFIATAEKKKKAYAISFLLLFVILLVFSASRTAIVISLLSFFIPIIFCFYRASFNKRNKSLFISVLIFGVVILSGIAALIISNLNFVFLLLNRTPTLTGRTEIWKVVSVYIKENLFVGYGAGGFWYSIKALDVWDLLNYPLLTSSHSGLYDFLLDYGLIGLILITIQYIFLIGRSLRLYLLNQGTTIWFLFYAIFTLLNNYSDSRFLNTTSIFWLFYVITSLITKKQLEMQRKGH